MHTTTIDRRHVYARREPTQRTADYYGRVTRGIRLLNALNLRFRRQGVCK